MFIPNETAPGQTLAIGLRNRARVSAPDMFDADTLLDGLIVHLDLKNDAALARALEVAPPIISKLRHRSLPVTAAVLIRMHEVSGLSINNLRLLMGDNRRRFGVGDQ
jgi:hypothetical protein